MMIRGLWGRAEPGPLFFFQLMAEKTHEKRKRGRPEGPEPTCSVMEAAVALGKSKWTIYDWLKELCSDDKPVLPHRRIGRGPGSVRIPVKYVDGIEKRLVLRIGPSRPGSFFPAKEQKDG